MKCANFGWKMEKKVHKRQHKPQVFVHPPNKRFRKAHYAIAVVVLVLVLIIASVSVLKSKKDPVLATVNGQAISASEVRILRALLPEAANVPDMQLINDSLVPQLLLLQDAAKRGIIVSDQELNDYIVQALKSGGTTQQDLEKNLAKAGITFEDFSRFVRTQLTIEALKKQLIDEAKLSLSETELNAFYEKNKNQLPANISIDDAKKLIVDFLSKQKQDEYVIQYVAKLRSTADVAFK